MRERINRLARGIIDNGSPELVLAPERVEASVPAGEVIRGEILVSSGNNLHIKGLVYSSHERVRVVNSAFGGLRNRIIYEVNVGFSEHGDEIKGSFYLVTNGGEREIPYSLRVQAGDSGEVLGNLKTPRDFGLLAKKDLEKALRMFEYQDFTEAPFMQDSRVRTIYDGLKGRAGRRNLLEEFLVALQVKEPVKLTLETGTRIYENLTGIAEDYIDISAGTWGYVSADITVDAPFIELGTFRITDQDFVQAALFPPGFTEEGILGASVLNPCGRNSLFPWRQRGIMGPAARSVNPARIGLWTMGAYINICPCVWIMRQGFMSRPFY